jgi:chemotaxis protein methyltransferase CheR
MLVDTLELTREDYNLIRRLVYAHSGINLGENKSQLVRVRLGKRLRAGGFRSFREYYRYVENDSSGRELCALLDAITTNTTHLFREPRHFQLLRDILTRWVNDRAWRAQHKTLRIWSAAGSSGEEPYSIGMVAHDVLNRHAPAIELKILATDLSAEVLSRAKLGVYDAHRVGTVPPDLRARYFQPVRIDGESALQIIPELRRQITFARFNLMTPEFPFRNRFNIIFCRNVMIYFDRATQETLVNKLARQLHGGGYLMIGHSESLNGIRHPLEYVEPTVYRRT